MHVKTLAGVLVSAFTLLAFGSAYAHGDHKPTHGGTVGRGDDDIVIEFVMENDTMTLYVDDEDGKPIETKDVKGTLTLVAPQRSGQEMKLVSAGNNKLAATGLKPVPGDRLRAHITLPSGEEFDSVALFRSAIQSRPRPAQGPIEPRVIAAPSSAVASKEEIQK